MSEQRWIITTVASEDAQSAVSLSDGTFRLAIFTHPVTPNRLAEIVGDPFADEEGKR